jgi:hypothetical protein
MQPFRLSLVGAKGPHLFDIVELIGNKKTIKNTKSNRYKNKVPNFGTFHYKKIIFRFIIPGFP